MSPTRLTKPMPDTEYEKGSALRRNVSPVQNIVNTAKEQALSTRVSWTGRELTTVAAIEGSSFA
jgi:hypothetical protein